MFLLAWFPVRPFGLSTATFHLHVCVFDLLTFRPPGFSAWILAAGYGALRWSWLRYFVLRLGLLPRASYFAQHFSPFGFWALFFELLLVCACAKNKRRGNKNTRIQENKHARERESERHQMLVNKKNAPAAPAAPPEPFFD